MKQRILAVCVLTLFALSPAFGAGEISQILEQAENGSSEAQLKLGQAYQYGRGLPQDYQKALHWYEKAASQGEAEAQRPLGALYEMGRGVAKDFGKAAFWYEKAAEQGLARAQVNLGILYENGQGVEKDLEKALFWYQKAADQGYGRGLNHLGGLYEAGLGGTRDINKALELYKQGAEAGYSKAMVNLGRIYEYGAKGVEKNLAEAVVWYQKAINTGYKNAAPDLKRVRESLKGELQVKVQADTTNFQKEEKSEEKVIAAPPPVPGAQQNSIERDGSELTVKAAGLAKGETLVDLVEEEKVLDEKNIPEGGFSEEIAKDAETAAEPALPAAAEKVPVPTLEAPDNISKEPEEGPSSMPYFAIVGGNIFLVLFFWFFIMRRRSVMIGAPSEVIGEIGNEIRDIRKQVEELKKKVKKNS